MDSPTDGMLVGRLPYHRPADTDFALWEIAAEFPGTPHRYCANPFLRDEAKPVMEEDRHAKVQMRKKVRGLRKIEQAVLKQQKAAAALPAAADAESADNIAAAASGLADGRCVERNPRLAPPGTVGTKRKKAVA